MTEPTLLLLDPDDSARRALAVLLRDAGYRVLEAHDGMEALPVVHGRLPDLVIVDPWPCFAASLRMVERLRSAAATRHVPVLAISSVVAPEYRNRALAAGCVGYLEKPCPPERVLVEVRRVVAPAPPAPAPLSADHA